jgi:glutathione S-transferase
MTQAMVLYANSAYSSPYVLSVYATLVEKGLPFELKTIRLDGEQFSADFTGISMTSRVPTLVHDDFSLSESSAIVEYLEDAYPSPKFVAALPTNVQDKARARQLMAWFRSDLGALREERSTSSFYAASHPKPLSEAAKKAADKLLHAADALIDDQGNHLFGQWSVADVDFAVMLNRLAANGDPVPDKVKHYIDRQWLREGMQKWWALAKSNV